MGPAFAVLALLLAGCDRPDEGLGPPYTEDRSFILPGVFANATLHEEPDGSYRVEAVAENQGDATYHVSAICVPPWTDAMEGPQGERVEHREPTGSCAAFGLRPFPPGAKEKATFAWDGRVWEEGGSRAAPAGLYTWNLTFEFFSEPQEAPSGQREEVNLRFPVHVA